MGLIEDNKIKPVRQEKEDEVETKKWQDEIKEGEEPEDKEDTKKWEEEKDEGLENMENIKNLTEEKEAKAILFARARCVR